MEKNKNKALFINALIATAAQNSSRTFRVATTTVCSVF